MTAKRWLIYSLVFGIFGAAVAWIWTLNSDAYALAYTAVNNSNVVISRSGVIENISLTASRIRKPIAIFRFKVKGTLASVVAEVRLSNGPDWQVQEITLD